MENAGPGYGVLGCRKHGVWKTRGLVENTGSQWKTRGLAKKHWGTIISPNNEFSSLKWEVPILFSFKLQWKSIGVIRVFRSWKRALQWFSFAWGVYLIFCSNLSGFIQFIFLLNSRNNEIIKIVLGIFITMKKPFYTNNHFRLQTWTFSATRGPVITYRWLTFSWFPLNVI